MRTSKPKKPIEPAWRRWGRVALAGAGGGGLAVALLQASLDAAGIKGINLAYLYLALAWVAGVGATAFAESSWALRRTTRWTILGVVASAWGAALFTAGVFEHFAAKNQMPAVTQSELTAALRQPPRVIIDQIEPVTPTKDDDLRFNIHFANQGQAAVTTPRPHFGIGGAKGPGRLSPEMLDRAFADFSKFGTPPLSSDTLEQGQGRISTLPGMLTEHTGITAAELKSLQRSMGALYLLIDLRYRDVRDGTAWESQLCQYWDFNVPANLLPRMAPHLCTSHNGVFRTKG